MMPYSAIYFSTCSPAYKQMHAIIGVIVDKHLMYESDYLSVQLVSTSERNIKGNCR
jgi:hypothetical protein